LGAEVATAESREFGRTETRTLAFIVGFFFSFRLCIVLLSTILLGLEPNTGSAISLGINIGVFGLVVYGTASEAPGTFRDIFKPAPAKWAIAFLILSGVSLLWSETASKVVSFAYWAGLVIDVMNVAIILRRDTGLDEAHSLLKGFVWSSCSLALLAWAMPAASDMRLGDEQFFNPNQIGNVCAFAIFFAQYLMRSKDGDWRIINLFLVVTLIRSLSKTTIAAFLVGEGLLLVFDRSMSRKAKALVLMLFVFLLLLFWGLITAYYDYYTNNGNQAETLTGRLVIWLYVLAGVGDHAWTFWIGHGFDSWWKVVPPFGGQLFEARHAENEILQQLYAYGVAGLVVLTGVYVSLFREFRRINQAAVKAIFCSFIGFVLIRGLAEAEAFDMLLPLWSIVLISALAGAYSGASRVENSQALRC
jgi:exopolysaccharide production protein ExoQ